MAFGAVTKNADGTSRSVAELNREFGKVADLVATMPTNAAMSYREGVDSLKLSAPYAHLLKFDPGLLGVMSETMAEQGIRGSESSVAQRSLFQSLLKPKSTAISTLEAMGVRYYDYVKFAPDFKLTPEAFAKYAQRNGYSLTTGTAALAFKKAQAAQLGSGGSNDWLNDLGQNLAGTLIREKTPATPKQTTEFVSGWMGSAVQNADVLGLLLAMRAAHGGAGLTGGEWGRIGEGRQFPRLSPLFNPKGGGALDASSQSMSRTYGDDWKAKVAAHEELKPAYIGNAMRQAAEHAKGLEGAINRLKYSFTDLNDSLSQSGFYNRVEHGLDGLTAMVKAVSSLNPHTLSNVATGLGAIALLGPSLFIGGKLMGLAVGITRFAGALTGLSAVVASANAVPAIAKAAASAGGGAGAGAPSAAALAARGLPAGAAATAGLGMGAIGLAAGVVSGGLLNEVMNGLRFAGVVDPNLSKQGKGPGRWEHSGSGRTRSRRWMPDSLFERFDQENPTSTSVLGGMYSVLTASDQWLHRPRNSGPIWGHYASAAEVATLGHIGTNFLGKSGNFNGLTPTGSGAPFFGQGIKPVRLASPPPIKG